MFAVVRKTCLAFVLAVVVLTTGAWQSDQVVLAQSQDPNLPETPLFPGLTWTSLGLATRDIRTSLNGDSFSLSGERFGASEQFPSGLPQDVLDFYSNTGLAASGWASYDVVNTTDGIHYVYVHEASRVYLSLEYTACPDSPSSTCLAVWKSVPAQPAATAASTSAGPTTAGSFGKTSPTNGDTGLTPTSTTLSWGSSSGADKYKYCVQLDSACSNDDPDWLSVYSRSVTLTNLSASKTYYWQVRATDCETCVPKNWVYANSGTAWWFKTKAVNEVTILGNAGVGSATLSYRDGSDKRVTADAIGNYTIRVPLNWTGTITPSKSGYLFSPASASFTNLTANQTIQNFSATRIFVISGNAGIAGATLSYTNGTPLTVTSDASGNYSINVPSGWTGTVTPSKPGYSFAPVNRSYTNVTANQTAQNYVATFITYNITGNTVVGGVTLTYTDGVPQFATSDGSGNYVITVPQGWTGVVTPHKIGYSFTPASISYTNVQAHQTSQNYTSHVCASCADRDTTGVFRPGNGLLYLKNLNITGFADVSINYGLAGDYPVVGDWDGNGTATIGVYRGGSFYLRNSNTLGFADLVIPFGQVGDQPIAGDWDGNGTDTIGVFRPSTGLFLLRNSNTPGAEDVSFFLGNPGDVAIAGDWNGDGTDTTGVFRPGNGVIFLKNANTTGIADVTLNYGLPGDKPVTGDWDGNGTDTIGVYRGNVFYLRNSNTVGFADLTFALGLPGDMPIAGNWDNLP
jgi:hypothetical protein